MYQHSHTHEEDHDQHFPALAEVLAFQRRQEHHTIELLSPSSLPKEHMEEEASGEAASVVVGSDESPNLGGWEMQLPVLVPAC